MNMEKLGQDDIDRRMADFPEWSAGSDCLQRTFSFDDFIGAMSFVSRVADLAEQLQHHPDIMIRYNKVTLTLRTHDAGGITEKDFAFAREMDATTAANSD